MCEKINDFGQKIGGARKDMYQAVQEWAAKFAEASLVEALKAAKKLSDLVKLPDLARLVKAGALSAEGARAILTIWRTVGRRPSWRVYSWAMSTAPKMARVAELLGGAEPSDEEKDNTEYKVLCAANWPAENFSFGKYEVGVACLTNDYIITSGDHDLHACNIYDINVIVEKLRALVDGDAARRAEGPALCGYCNRAGRYYIAPSGKPEICIYLFPEGATSSDVHTKLREDRAALCDMYKKIKTVPEIRHDWNRPRVGEDWRRGEDVTPEHYAAALPFRGVEFGNWVNQVERAALLNSAFDGFHDLAKILSVPAGALTLGGSLAFAFASRGVGKAAAHYETGKKVINLTKKNGAGCMAHEWFHALDNYAAKQCAGVFFATEAGAGTPGRVAETGRAILNAIYKTDYFARSKKMAELKGDYWVEGCELTARAFEAVAAYLLKRAGIVSDFLVNCLSMDEFTEKDVLHRSNIYPYPSEAEAAALVPLYADFLRAVLGGAAGTLSAETLADAERLAAQAENERVAMETARAEREKAVAAEKERQRAARHFAQGETVKKQAEAAAAEVGGWYHVFDSLGAWCAVGGNEEFIFTIHRGFVCWRVVRPNKRIKSAFRGARGIYCEARDINTIREELIAAAGRDVTIANRHFYNTLYMEATPRTLAELLGLYASKVEAARAECAEVRAAAQTKTPAAPDSTAEVETARKAASRPNKAAAARSVGAGRAEGVTAENGAKQTEEGAPHESLTLAEMEGGVYVEGSTRATYFNRRAIKAHGAAWNKEKARWEATTAEAVASLRGWFALRGAIA